MSEEHGMIVVLLFTIAIGSFMLGSMYNCMLGWIAAAIFGLLGMLACAIYANDD